MKLSTYLGRRAETRVSFAYELGVSPQIVSDWILGRRRPKVDTALEIDKLTGGAVPWTQWYKQRQGKA